MADGRIDFVTRAPAAGSMDVRWIHGESARRRNGDPPIQVHHYDRHTVILRQSKSVNYEAPFLYLLFGNERAVLLDTGATADPAKFPLRATVDQLIAEWLAQHPRDTYQLVIAHTHGHNDHVAADAQFADRPATTVVNREPDAVQRYFGFTNWPEQVVTFDLGGRILDVTGSPGHHQAAITIYDRWTGSLLTGDTVYPGRLYAYDFAQFLASLDRMVALADSRVVTHVLGCHIEMTRQAGRDYPLGATYQPDERPLEMTVAQLKEVRAAARSVAERQGVHPFDDFIIYNQPSKRDQLNLIARGLLHKVRRS
ncbi:MAG TPA: MBL fold metallo-hydrolase [Streptosporangiaceae bacterium]|jgi:hydroxyacylglutathione hydrolase|nr:MBL fold metallo-hydrolase [Streptosporangiaceae bacterium]